MPRVYVLESSYVAHAGWGTFSSCEIRSRPKSGTRVQHARTTLLEGAAPPASNGVHRRVVSLGRESAVN